MIKKITLTFVLLLCATLQYAQVSVYSDYKFEGPSGVTVSSLKNKDGAKFLTTDEKGTLVLKEAPTADLQTQVNDLKKQIEELKQLYSAQQNNASAQSDSYNFKIYPNPSNGQFEFEFTQNTPDELAIYDVNGHEMKRIPVTSSSTKVNLQQLASGYYIVNILSKGTVVNTRNILIK